MKRDGEYDNRYMYESCQNLCENTTRILLFTWSVIYYFRVRLSFFRPSF